MVLALFLSDTYSPRDRQTQQQQLFSQRVNRHLRDFRQTSAPVCACSARILACAVQSQHSVSGFYLATNKSVCCRIFTYTSRC